MSELDIIALAGKKAKGKRPYFFNDPDVERVLSITMAVAGELAVTRERLDTIERLLEEKQLLNREEIEAFVPSKEAAAQRAQWQQEYIARVLRIVQQSLEELDNNKEAEPDSYQKIMDALSKDK